MSKSKLTLGKSGERPEFKTKANGANRRLVADRVSLTLETPPQVADDRTCFRACETEIMLPGPRALNWIQLELQ